IGQAICSALKNATATVVAADLAESVEMVCDQYMTLDVTDAEQWATAAEMIEDSYGRLDALVNNAGIASVRSLEAVSLEEWRHVQSVN
ncbi:MAG: SDR family oxidoreductase, partial [Burkholderiales bacterium]|nr:SDR family oxidoreductase [Burkholderiales bacterium]